MAIYHLTVKTGSRSKGSSAKDKAQYIQREERFRGRDPVRYAESGNMPGWARDNPTDYWAAADKHERANGRLYKELEYALPKELDAEAQVELARRFARDLTQGELPYTLAVHEGKGANPHAHLMISERVNDRVERSAEQWFRRANRAEPERGGAFKTERMKPKAWLELAREAWAERANGALRERGYAATLDHRSLKAQGIDRVPTEHIGRRALALEAKGVRTERGDRAAEIAHINQEKALGREASAKQPDYGPGYG